LKDLVNFINKTTSNRSNKVLTGCELGEGILHLSLFLQSELLDLVIVNACQLINPTDPP